MLKALIRENTLPYTVDPIRRIASQMLVVFLHLGDEVLKFFSLPGPHVMWVGSGGLVMVLALKAVVVATELRLLARNKVQMR